MLERLDRATGAHVVCVVLTVVRTNMLRDETELSTTIEEPLTYFLCQCLQKLPSFVDVNEHFQSAFPREFVRLLKSRTNYVG